MSLLLTWQPCQRWLLTNHSYSVSLFTSRISTELELPNILSMPGAVPVLVTGLTLQRDVAGLFGACVTLVSCLLQQFGLGHQCQIRN